MPQNVRYAAISLSLQSSVRLTSPPTPPRARPYRPSPAARAATSFPSGAREASPPPSPRSARSQSPPPREQRSPRRAGSLHTSVRQLRAWHARCDLLHLERGCGQDDAESSHERERIGDLVKLARAVRSEE